MRNSYSLNEEGKQKEPITQSIRNRRERSSRFKMMFYVIGSEESKSGSASYNSCRQNQRRGGADRHFRCTDTVSDHSGYLSICLNISIFSCPQRSIRYTILYKCCAVSSRPLAGVCNNDKNPHFEKGLCLLGHLHTKNQWVPSR